MAQNLNLSKPVLLRGNNMPFQLSPMRFFRKIKYLGGLSLLYLSMLSIRSKKIYVFGCWQGLKFADNPKYLYLEALKDKSIKAIWITKNKNVLSYMCKKGYPSYMSNSISGIYYQLRASVVFHCDRREDVSAHLIGNATCINLYHGVGPKKIIYDDDINHPRENGLNNDKKRYLKSIEEYAYRKGLVLSTSDTMTTLFSSAFRKPKEKLLQLGQPRNDVFFNNELEIEELPFIQPGKKMILYMPTHRQEGRSPFRLQDILNLAALDSFCEQSNSVFVIKKHFYHREEKEDLSIYKHIVDITASEHDAQLLLKKASLLITDYSSCYVDYLLLDKPVIFYNYDYESYVLKDRDLYFEYDKITPGPKVKDFPSLYKCLAAYTNEEKDEFRCERERVKNIFYSPENQQPVGEKILTYAKEKIS